MIDVHTRRVSTLTCWLLMIACLLSLQLTACTSPASPSSNSSKHHSLPTNNGSITYNTNSNEVIIRMFRGGGNLGTLEISPEISIYGDGSYISGMQQGKLDNPSLEQLLRTLIDTDGLLSLSQRQFYDLPDQNATLLQLMLNDKYYEFLYGQFGHLHESTQELNEYHRLGDALTNIVQALKGPLQTYSSTSMALLVHQDFSPDLTQNIPSWTLPDFTLAQVATYECGPIPADETGPDADTGCLTFTIPHAALLLTTLQLHGVSTLLNGHSQGIFYEHGLYYMVALRLLLPDELLSGTLAMFGGRELTYTAVPLHQGPIPALTPTP